tara:strand:+ start:125 stop:445 length:321 start_codon:yes stop_codon:yes gene_type:complete
MYSEQQHLDLAQIILWELDGKFTNKDWLRIPAILFASGEFDILNLDSINVQELHDALGWIMLRDAMEVRADKTFDREEAKKKAFDKLRSRGLLPAEKDLNPQLELF